jgi:hypothetical protein
VQGQLRGKHLECTIESECGHCGRPLRLEVDSALGCAIRDEGADPLVFVPMVNLGKLRDRSIIDAF